MLWYINGTISPEHWCKARLCVAVVCVCVRARARARPCALPLKRTARALEQLTNVGGAPISCAYVLRPPACNPLNC